MGNIQNSLKQASFQGMIKEEHAMIIGNKADQMLEKATNKLTELKGQVGMIIGGEIAELVSEIKGIRFNATEYYYDKQPDGQ